MPDNFGEWGTEIGQLTARLKSLDPNKALPIMAGLRKELERRRRNHERDIESLQDKLKSKLKKAKSQSEKEKLTAQYEAEVARREKKLTDAGNDLLRKGQARLKQAIATAERRKKS